MRKYLIILSILLPFTAFSQICNNFHKKYCKMNSAETGEIFSYNGQSRSALFEKGQTSELKFVVYKGQDYKISLCAEPQLGEELNFKIKDPKTGKVLYDNSEDDMAMNFEFTCEGTRTLSVEVSVPEGDSKSEKYKPDNMACVGILILHKTTEKTGF